MLDDLTIPNPGYRGNRAGRYGTGQSRIQQGMDPDTRRLMLFAGGLGIILSALIGASAVIGHRSSAIPVITADTRPIRIKPENPGGMKIDGAENDVFSGGADNTHPKLAAAAENPDTMALSATDDTPPAATEALPRTAPIPSTAAPLPVTPLPAAPSTTAPPLAQTKPAVVAIVPPLAKPPVLKPAAPSLAKPPVITTESHSAAPTHQAVVQLAAMTTEEAARNEWQQLVKRMPGLLNGHQPNFSRTERDGHTFWRVRTSGFADESQARGFCDHVRAKGGGCAVAD